MAGGYAEQEEQNNARFEEEKGQYFYTVCPDTNKLSVGQKRR